MKLTKLAQKLKEQRDSEQDLTPETEELANCMGSEEWSYALFEGGYLKPEEWIEGEDLKELQRAIKLVEEFKLIVAELHEE